MAPHWQPASEREVLHREKACQYPHVNRHTTLEMIRDSRPYAFFLLLTLKPIHSKPFENLVGNPNR